MNTRVADLNVEQIVVLTKDNLKEALEGLPRPMAYALKAVTGLKYGALRVTLPNGRTYSYSAPEPGPHGVATFHNWGIVKRVLKHGSLGVAESYIEGEWDSPAVTDFLELFTKNAYNDGGSDQFFARNRLLNLFTTFQHWLNSNSRSGSKRNISAHYDLGNAFYKQWLDPSMTYSAGVFSTGANSLEAAQEAKYQSLIERTDIRPEHHVLEIGCGWGGFAEYAARTIGCKVTCLTISREQYAYARDRIAAAGLSDKVEIKFQDYRDEKALYDRIASIEMFEAVGEKFWPSYFQRVRNCLVPGGKAGLQVITIRDEDFEHYRKNPDFIQKYVFPGGMLPTKSLLNEFGSRYGLNQISEFDFGLDYAETLERWRHKFWDKWEIIKPLGFDERFKRIWDFYFHYCEAGFKAEAIDVRQVVYVKA